MKRISFTFILLWSILLHCSAEKPNILFIMSDDHTSQAVGVYGSRLAKLNPTPTIDTLAKEGVLMKNVFCTNAICVPSRASIMTGQYPHTNGVTNLYGKLPPEDQYLAIEMKKAGYQTAVIGKWHLKQEPNFDYYKVLPGQGSFKDPTFREKGQGKFPKNSVKMKGHSSDCITDSTLHWFKNIRKKGEPFFLLHQYKAPHDMFDNAERYDSYLEDVDIPEPENLWEQPDYGSIGTLGNDKELENYIGTSTGPRHKFRNYVNSLLRPKNPESMSEKELKDKAYQYYLKKYLRCVKGVDDNLARLFKYLKDEGLYDNTIIIYTGDQGFMLGEHDLIDKRWMYEESQRMPFIVRYPKSIKAGTVSDAIIENVDFGPMMLDYAGVKTPSYMEGKSFRSILETGVEPKDWRQEAYYHYSMHMAHHWNPAHFGIRTKKHKLIYFYGCDNDGHTKEEKLYTPPSWEFYNLTNDPDENVNQYDNPEYKEIIEQLKVQLKEKQKAIGDTSDNAPSKKAVIEEFWDYDNEDRAKAIEISKRAVKWIDDRMEPLSDPKRMNKGPFIKTTKKKK